MVVKGGPAEQILHEAAILLAAPPGVAPALLDLPWSPPDGPGAVMEVLEGEPLSASRLDSDAAPALLQAACQCLIHLHRSGIQHLDVRPENLFLLAGEPVPTIRLLDFGFSRNASGALSGSGATLGGTPAYMAPEVLRGWAYDHRADQYSLGVTWKTLFPSLSGQAAWGAVLERMCAPAPADRFPHLVALREELEARFGLRSRSDWTPRLGGGPMLGRDAALARLIGLLSPEGPVERILLVGQPGTGLTRFALEALLAMARQAQVGTRPTILVVRGDSAAAPHVARFHAFLKERAGAGERLLCVVPDASPGLHGVPAELAVALRDLAAGPRGCRFMLEPVDAESFAESVAQALGSGGGLSRGIGEFLHGRSGGNFRIAGSALDEILGRLSFCENGLALCSSEPDASSLSRWRPSSPDSLGSLDSLAAGVPPDLIDALSLSALASSSCPRAIARGLLEAFAEPGSWDALIDRGYLLPGPGGRVSFATPGLFERARQRAAPRAAQVDAWLNEHWAPDPNRAAEVLAACDRARAVGDRERERRHLDAGLRAATRDRSWDRLRLLIGTYGGAPPPASPDELRRRVGDLSALLGPPWRDSELLYAAAWAFNPVAPDIAQPILQELAEGRDTDVALKAQLARFDRLFATGDEEGCARGIANLRVLVSGRETWMSGYVDWARAAHAFHHDRSTEAERLARRAADALAGRDALREALCAQMLAILRFESDPAEGLRLLESAEAGAQDAAEKARICANLSGMRQSLNDLEGGLAALERGLAAVADEPGSPWALSLRSRRVWALLELGHIDRALAEASRLLELWGLRQMPAAHNSTLLATAVGMHYRDGSRAAVAELARAWVSARVGASRNLTLSALRYLCDALLDLEAWDLARVHGPALRAEVDGDDPSARITGARLDALLAQAGGRAAEAAARVDAVEAPGSGELPLEERAWFLFHRAHARHCAALVARDRAGALAAARSLQPVLELFTDDARSYLVERARLERARALATAGLGEEAIAEIDAGIARLRATEYRGLLARALRSRAQFALAAASGDASPRGGSHAQ